jgi:hypothetical protein
MRPVLGDRQAVRSGFQVRFDPVNTLIMSMVGEEIGRRRIQKSSEMSPGSKLRLRQIYQALSPTMPTDQAASNFAQRLNLPTATPLIMGTEQVVAQIVSSARANSALPIAVEGITTGPTRRTGDALTNYYVQQAAGISRFLPDNIATSSFLLGLGIALDDSQTLRNHPKFGAFVRSVEADYERSLRLSMLGDYTMRGRADLAKQFFIAAHMAASAGAPVATTEGLSAELAASFSFADIAANRAGALFAGGVSSKRFTLLAISEGFTVPTYMPSVEGLPDALPAAELAAQFGAPTDSLFREQLQRIDQRLLQLPPYRKPKVALER